MNGGGRGQFSRKVAGTTTEQQVVAANIDTALIVQSCHYDFNVRRLDRYLVMANDGGIQPLIVLTKCDLIAPGELEQELPRRVRVPFRPVEACPDPEDPAKRREGVFAEHPRPAGEHEGVDHGVSRPRSPRQARLLLQEREIERGVVEDERVVPERPRAPSPSMGQ